MASSLWRKTSSIASLRIVVIAEGEVREARFLQRSRPWFSVCPAIALPNKGFMSLKVAVTGPVRIGEGWRIVQIWHGVFFCPQMPTKSADDYGNSSLWMSLDLSDHPSPLWLTGCVRSCPHVNSFAVRHDIVQYPYRLL